MVLPKLMLHAHVRAIIFTDVKNRGFLAWHPAPNFVLAKMWDTRTCRNAVASHKIYIARVTAECIGSDFVRFCSKATRAHSYSIAELNAQSVCPSPKTVPWLSKDWRHQNCFITFSHIVLSASPLPLRKLSSRRLPPATVYMCNRRRCDVTEWIWETLSRIGCRERTRLRLGWRETLMIEHCGAAPLSLILYVIEWVFTGTATHAYLDRNVLQVCSCNTVHVCASLNLSRPNE